jgi:NAD(P) transhydrogenase subunit alpha
MGRKAPILLTKAMVEVMPQGSIIVDLAAEMGGNCELTKPDENIKVGGVTIMGYCNTASLLATDASQLYARNVFNFVSLIINKENGSLRIDYDDPIIAGTNLTRDGKIVHPIFTRGGEVK